jgi:hypothetical protein
VQAVEPPTAPGEAGDAASTKADGGDGAEVSPPPVLKEGLAVVVQGVQPSLQTPLYELCQHMCHADAFLYVCVSNAVRQSALSESQVAAGKGVEKAGDAGSSGTGPAGGGGTAGT